MDKPTPPDWADEALLYPYQASPWIPARRLLVLAPHPDDEVLGCGGLIASSLQHQAEVHVVIASDGALGGDAPQRAAESRAAALVLAGGGAAPVLSFWGLADRGLAGDGSLTQRVGEVLAADGPDLVLLPSPFEIHPDHRALCLAGMRALRLAPAGTSALFYEIGQPLLADVLVDITPQLALKRAALRCFASQLAQQAYDDQLLGLNRFRAYTLGSEVSHAEAFQRVDPACCSVSGVAGAVAQALFKRFRGLA